MLILMSGRRCPALLLPAATMTCWCSMPFCMFHTAWYKVYHQLTEREDRDFGMSAQVMVYNSYKDGMDVTVRHLVPEKLPAFVLQKASDAQQAAKAVTQAAEVDLRSKPQLDIPQQHGGGMHPWACPRTKICHA